MVEVKEGLIYKDGKLINIKELEELSEEEIGDKELYQAVKRSKETGKPLIIADVGIRRGTNRVTGILNGRREAIEKIKNGNYFLGTYGFASMNHLFYPRLFSYLGADKRNVFRKEFVVYETFQLKKYLSKLKKMVEEAESVNITEKERADLLARIKGLGGELLPDLFPHQEKFLYLALRRLAFNEKRGKNKGLFLADDMGLGKTLQTLALVKATNTFPLLIICPKPAADVWKAEVEDWLGLEAKVYTTKDKGFDPNFKVHIIPISIFSLKKFRENAFYYYKEKIRFVAIDESHTIKSISTNRTKMVKTFVKKLREKNKDLIVMAISGTPQTVSPEDYLPQLDVIGFLDNEGITYNAFRERYVFYKKIKVKGKDEHIERPWGAKNPYELNLWLKATVMVKRAREQALKNLPHKGVIEDKVPLIHKKGYKKVLEEFKEDTTAYQKLRQWLSLEKIPYTLKYVREAVAGGEKIVVLAHYKETQEILKAEIEKVLKEFGGELVYYSANARNKGELVKKFQEDPNVKVFLGSFQSAKQSITLTAAKTMVIHDIPTIYADKIQAEQRIHRIGQDKDVVIIYPVLKKTIETKILSVLNTRKEEADKLLGNPEEVWKLVFGDDDNGPGLK